AFAMLWAEMIDVRNETVSRYGSTWGDDPGDLALSAAFASPSAMYRHCMFASSLLLRLAGDDVWTLAGQIGKDAKHPGAQIRRFMIYRRAKHMASTNAGFGLDQRTFHRTSVESAAAA